MPSLLHLSCQLFSDWKVPRLILIFLYGFFLFPSSARFSWRIVHRGARARALGRRSNHFSYVADTICSCPVAVSSHFTFKLIVSLTRVLKPGTPWQIRSNEIYFQRTTTKQTISDNLSPPRTVIYIEQGTAMIAFGIH